MAEDEDLLHGGPAEIEITMVQPELFVGLGAVHFERRRRRRVIDDQIRRADLDAAGLELGIVLAGQPRSDDPLDADHVLVAQLAAAGLKLVAGLRLENDLSQAVAVAQVDEQQAAEIAPGVHPAVQDHVLTDLLGRQIAAGVRSFQEHGRIVQSRFKVWIYQRPKLITYKYDTGVHRRPSRQRSDGHTPERSGSSSAFIVVEYDRDEVVRPLDRNAFRNVTRMKFDAARVAGMMENLADPQYHGLGGEAKVADFLADQFTQIGMAVERREVVGSGLPPRVAPRIGWLAHGVVVTTIYFMLYQNDSRDGAWIFALLVVFSRLMIAAVAIRHRWGRHNLPRDTAPLLIASFLRDATPPIRIVFHAVLGGLSAKLLQTHRASSFPYGPDPYVF